jgi:hypothetical protein
MSHTQSRGLVTAAHYGTMAVFVYFAIHRILEQRRCTGKEIEKGARKAFERFINAALSGVEFDRTRKTREGVGTTRSIATLQVARNAASTQRISTDTLPLFLEEMGSLVGGLRRKHALAAEESLKLLAIAAFLQAIADAGEREREAHRVTDDDD